MLRKSLIIAVLALVIDQLSKIITLDFFESQKSYFLELTSFFNMVMVWNCGVSFGLFNGCEEMPQYQPYLLSAVAIIICAVVLQWVRKSSRKWDAIAGGLIIGGALSNVIDRFVYGAVVDFLDFHIGSFHWPAFNFADSFICIGVFMLVADGIFGINKKNKS